MNCLSCQKPLKGEKEICKNCQGDKRFTISMTDIKTKYKILEEDLVNNNIRTFEFQKGHYFSNKRCLVSDIWILCDKLTKDLPDTNKKKIAYKTQRSVIEKLIKDLERGAELEIIIKENVNSLLKKYDIDMNNDVKEFIKGKSHEYSLKENADVFKASMEIAEEVNKYYLDKQLRLKRTQELGKLLKNQNMLFVQNTKIYKEYINNGGSLNNTFQLIQLEIVKKEEQDDRERLLKTELNKNGLTKYKDDKRCSHYVKYGQVSLDKLIADIVKDDIRQKKEDVFKNMTSKYRVSKIIYANTHDSYMNGQLTLSDAEQIYKSESEKHSRDNKVLGFINCTIGTRYRYLVLMKYKSNIQVQEYIIKGSIAFDKIKEIILDIEEEFVNADQNLSDKWKIFLKSVNRQPSRLINKDDRKIDTMLFDFCDSSNKQIQYTEQNINKRNYILYRCGQLGLKPDLKSVHYNCLKISKPPNFL